MEKLKLITIFFENELFAYVNVKILNIFNVLWKRNKNEKFSIYLLRL